MMKKLSIGLIFLCFVTFRLFAQEAASDTTANDTVPSWTFGGMGSLTFNEAALSNWAAGGQSNIALIGNLNLFANHKADKAEWENSLDLAYGFIRNNFIFDPGGPITKAEDKLEFNSKYGRKTSNDKLFLSALATFRTQFTPGYAAPGAPVYISRGLSPAYFILALGLDFKPNDKLSFFLSPISGKATFVTDDSLAQTGAFGVNSRDGAGDLRPGSFDHARFEFGATLKAKYKADIAKNVGLETNLELFSNYIDRPQNIDLRITNALVAKINKYLSANLFLDIIYDHDVLIPIVDRQGQPVYSINPDQMPAPYDDGTYWQGPDFATNPDDVLRVQRKGPRLQIKQIFGLGLSYKF